jgi:hypothetical protein
MHGGALGSGGPSGNRNGRYTVGWHTREMIEERRLLRDLVREAQELADRIS